MRLQLIIIQLIGKYKVDLKNLESSMKYVAN